MTYFLDLFSGIGGFALGTYWAGLRFDEHYFSEVNDYAIKVYQQRFPDAIGLGDIRKIRGQDLPKGDWITCGGFPCQDISVAGKGAGLAGERSGLWFEYARLIGEVRPRYAIMENVGALSFRGLETVLGSLAEIGYDAEWCNICASDVGAPHKRERLWIVGYPHSMRMERQGAKFQTARTGRTGKDVADTSSKRLERRKETILKEERWHSCTGYDREKAGSGWRNSQWATEPNVGRVANGVPSRVDRLKCLGNSIVPQIAELIFSQAVFDKYRLVHEK